MRATFLIVLLSLSIFIPVAYAANSSSSLNSGKIDKALMEAIAGRNLGKSSKDAQAMVDKINHEEQVAKAKALAEAKEKARLEAEAKAEAERVAAAEAARIAEEARLAQVAAEQARAAQAAQQQRQTASYGSGCDWLRGELLANGVSEADVPAALNIATRESGCRQGATNPDGGACNVFQELPCGKWGGSNDLAGHIRGASNYAANRYGGWWGAWSAWQSKHWW